VPRLPRCPTANSPRAGAGCYTSNAEGSGHELNSRVHTSRTRTMSHKRRAKRRNTEYLTQMTVWGYFWNIRNVRLCETGRVGKRRHARVPYSRWHSALSNGQSAPRGVNAHDPDNCMQLLLEHRERPTFSDIMPGFRFWVAFPRTAP